MIERKKEKKKERKKEKAIGFWRRVGVGNRWRRVRPGASACALAWWRQRQSTTALFYFVRYVVLDHRCRDNSTWFLGLVACYPANYEVLSLCGVSVLIQWWSSLPVEYFNWNFNRNLPSGHQPVLIFVKKCQANANADRYPADIIHRTVSEIVGPLVKEFLLTTSLLFHSVHIPRKKGFIAYQNLSKISFFLSINLIETLWKNAENELWQHGQYPFQSYHSSNRYIVLEIILLVWNLIHFSLPERRSIWLLVNSIQPPFFASFFSSFPNRPLSASRKESKKRT